MKKKLPNPVSAMRVVTRPVHPGAKNYASWSTTNGIIWNLTTGVLLLDVRLREREKATKIIN
jgi:hypothetical protein